MDHFDHMMFHLGYYMGTELYFVGKVQNMGYMVVCHTGSVTGLLVCKLLQIDCSVLHYEC
jgi:hypothetical protein